MRNNKVMRGVGALFLCAMLMGSVITECAEPKGAFSPDRNCRQNGPMMICALRAAISADSRSGQNLSIHASLSLEITNSGELPVTLFGSTGAPASFQPDHGAEIAGVPQVRGIPICNSSPQNCLANKAFVPVRLAPHSTANVNLNIQERIARENVARIALATTAVFSGQIYVLDGNEQLTSISISLPVLGLDNGLTGI